MTQGKTIIRFVQPETVTRILPPLVAGLNGETANDDRPEGLTLFYELCFLVASEPMKREEKIDGTRNQHARDLANARVLFTAVKAERIVNGFNSHSAVSNVETPVSTHCPFIVSCAPREALYPAGAPMYTNELAQFISDANQKARPKVKKLAPHLLKPLSKAYQLAYNDHVILYPPSQLHPNWIAGVYSQNPAKGDQYFIRRDENGHLICTCPSFAKEQYQYNGRTLCKHTMAVRLIVEAHDAQAKQAPDSMSIPAQIVAVRQLAAV